MPGLYVYGIVPADRGIVETLGLDDRPVRLVAHEAVGALVSDAGDEALLGRRRELLRHAEVLDEALQVTPVLPLRFGTIADGEGDLVNAMLAPRHDELVALLEEIDGLVEVRLRGTYDEPTVLAEVVAERPELQRAGQAMGDRIRVGEQVALALDAKRDADTAAVLDRLTPLARDVTSDPPMTELMAFNVAFLLDADVLERFDAAVQEVGDELGERIHLKYIGPVPPASFVDLALPGQGG